MLQGLLRGIVRAYAVVMSLLAL